MSDMTSGTKIVQPSTKMKPGKGTKTGLQHTTNWPATGPGTKSFPGKKGK